MEKIERWIVTDPNCNQCRLDISDHEFLFKEDRLWNPITKETKEYSTIIDTNDYDWDEIIDICDAFGYSKEEVYSWLNNKENLALIAECIFEMTDD